MQARIKINSRLLSCFTLIIRFNSNIALVIILFSDRLNPIKTPFLSKLYIFFGYNLILFNNYCKLGVKEQVNKILNKTSAK
jgi:hypothetical protein